MGHRTPQLGTYTYCKIHALCKIFALHKTVVLRVFFLFRFFFPFFFGKNRLESRFLEYGQGSGFVWDVCSFTYYRIPGLFFQKKKQEKKKLSRVNCDNFLVYDGKNRGWIQKESRRERKGATHTVLFSRSRKLAHSRGGIVLYRWNYFARKKTGSSMICVPRSCCAELFAGPQRCQERWGWRCWWKASQACQNISWKLMNWVLRSWKV